MTSAAIMALIKEKEKEKKRLSDLLTTIKKTESGLDCYSYAFNKAASAIESAGSIGNGPIDGGKTKERANQFSNLTGSITALSQDIKAEINSLEEEIEKLYIQYEAALEEERRREKERREAQKRMMNVV